MYKKEDIQKEKSCLCVRLYAALTHPLYLEQLYQLLKIAWPLILSQVLDQFVYTLTAIYTGHLGKEILDAMALGSTAINIVAYSLAYGFNSACDTLFPQTYGSENKSNLGILLQKAIVINIFIGIPVYATFFNMDYTFVILGQDPVISKLARRFMVLSIPSIISSVVTLILSKYLAHQNIVRPSMLILMLINLIHWPLLQMFVVYFNLGLDGAAVAVDVSYTCGALLHVTYIFTSGVYKETWSGWSLECLQEWRGFMQLGVYGMMMTCLNMWAMEINIMLSGMLGKIELGGQYVAVATLNFFVALSYGTALSVNVRVGNLIGHGDHVTARIVTRVGIALGFGCGILAGGMFFIKGQALMKLFTDESDVVSLTSIIVPFLASYMGLDHVRSICGATIRGIGRQRFGAFMTFIGVYCIALPLGVYLTFYRSMGLKGIWYGICAAEFIRVVAFMLKVWTVDWKHEAMLARHRTKFSDEKCEFIEDAQGLLEETSDAVEDHDTRTLRVTSILLYRVLLFLALIVVLISSVILHSHLEPTFWRQNITQTSHLSEFEVGTNPFG